MAEADTPARITPAQRAQEERVQKLAEVQEEIDSGRMTRRQLTPEEMEQHAGRREDSRPSAWNASASSGCNQATYTDRLEAEAVDSSGGTSNNRAVRQWTRELGTWSAGFAPSNRADYSAIEWDPETGDAEVWEYAQDDQLLRRFVWQRQVAETRVLVVEFAADGGEVGRRYVSAPDSTQGW